MSGSRHHQWEVGYLLAGWVAGVDGRELLGDLWGLCSLQWSTQISRTLREYTWCELRFTSSDILRDILDSLHGCSSILVSQSKQDSVLFNDQPQ